MNSVKDQRKDLIFEAFIEVINETGYSDLTVSKVAEKANVSKSLIFYYFDSKEDLVKKVLQWMNEDEELNEHVESLSSAEDIVDFFLTREGPTYDIRKALVHLSHAEDIDLGEEFQEMHENIEETISRVLERDGYEDTERRANLILTSIIGAIFRGEAQDDGIDLEKKKAEIKSLLL